MTKGKPRKGSAETPEEALARAEQALAEAKEDREEQSVNGIVGIARSLAAGWQRVHERNNLASLFEREYGRTQ